MAPVTPIQTPTRASSALQVHAPGFTAQMTNQNNQPTSLGQTSGESIHRKPGPRRAVPIRNPADKTSEQLPKKETAVVAPNSSNSTTVSEAGWIPRLEHSCLGYLLTLATKKQPILYYRFPPGTKVEPISNAANMTSVINRGPDTDTNAVASQDPAVSTGHVTPCSDSAIDENPPVIPEIHKPVPEVMVKNQAIQSVPAPGSDAASESYVQKEANDDDLIDLKAQPEPSLEELSPRKAVCVEPTTQSVPPHLRHKVEVSQVRQPETPPTTSTAVQPGDGHVRAQGERPVHEDPFDLMWQKELDKKTREARERQAKLAEEALLKARATESALMNSNIDKIKALATRKRPANRSEQPPAMSVATSASGTASVPSSAAFVPPVNTTGQKPDRVSQPLSSSEHRKELFAMKPPGSPRPFAAQPPAQAAVPAVFTEHDIALQTRLMEERPKVATQRRADMERQEDDKRRMLIKQKLDNLGPPPRRDDHTVQPGEQKLSKEVNAGNAVVETLVAGSNWW